MPKSWYDRHEIMRSVPENKQQLYKNIVADRKPYFMIYIYSSLAKQYREYTKRSSKNCLREFDVTLQELLCTPADKLSERQLEFVQYYKKYLPVGVGECVVNIVCNKIERQFDGIIGRYNSMRPFDYTIYKSDCEYSYSRMTEIRSLLKEYDRRIQSYYIYAQYERVDKDDALTELAVMEDDFREQCQKVCPNDEELCNIILDLCYKTDKSKRFAWKMCGNQIIKNLLSKNNGEISVPVEDIAGDIQFNSRRFAVASFNLKDGDFSADHSE